MRTVPDRVKILNVVQTPMSFYVLVVLIVKHVHGVNYAVSDQKDVVLLYIMPDIITFLIVSVSVLALSGHIH